VGAEVTAALERLLDLVARDSHAPTAVRDPRSAVDAHVADSLSYLDLPGLRERRDIVDMGSGAGFPGLVLALALPGQRVDLVEASGRKCEFLLRTIDSLAIENVTVVQARLEEFGGAAGAEAYEVATARALGSLATVLEYAAPLLRPGGEVVAWKGRRNHAEETQAAAAADTLGLESEPPREVRPYPASRHRHLYLYRRVRTIPAGFPRRSGLAAKRPLGKRPGA
jgi:16S rRNA (guanine527-N7)-methyltransferase